MARVRSEAYDDRRQEILDRAAGLFARHGFSRTSISTLSRECNASKAWIYHYYESKEAILFDILHDHIRMLRDTVQAADDPEAAQKVMAYFGGGGLYAMPSRSEPLL